MERITVQDLPKIKSLKGKIICFPTDTVYGIGALASDSEGIEKIYKMKHREAKKPLPILCSTIEQVKKIAIVDEAVEKIMIKHWPGALTIILNKKVNVLPNYQSTVAVRIPNEQIALDTINYFSILATTSVNISGEKELSSIEEIANEFDDVIDYCIIDSAKFSKVPSTIIDATTADIKIIRQGSVII